MHEGQSPGSGLISILSKLARSLVSALEHLGKYHCGVGSCLACPGNAGIVAGFTGFKFRSKRICGLLQAINGSANGNSIVSAP